jgi:hypothetical protein
VGSRSPSLPLDDGGKEPLPLLQGLKAEERRWRRRLREAPGGLRLEMDVDVSYIYWVNNGSIF